MEELEYITKNGLLQCSEGSAPGIFTPTYNATVKINGCVVATEVDKISMANVPSFVVCKKTNKTCTPATTEWQNTYPVKVKGQQTLIGKSCMTCGVGGKIEFMMSGQVPLSAEEQAQLNAARDDIKESHGKEMEEKNKPWWQKAGEFVVDCVPVVGPVVSLVKNVSEGNWGMAALDVGFLALDVVGLVAAPFTGGASVAGATVAKAGIRQAVKAGAKQVAKKLSKEALELAAKQTGEMLSRASLRRLTLGRLCVFACFPAGTPVATKDGLKNIEEIKLGDEVWAYDDEKKYNVLEEVLYCFEKKVEILISILLENGECIETTSEHEFWTRHNYQIVRKKKSIEYVADGIDEYGIVSDSENVIECDDWIMAQDLVIGDYLQSKNGEDVRISDIAVFAKKTTVYNFCTSTHHNYFVGQTQILVHNKICYKEVFFKAFPSLRGKVVVHHAIEQQVLKKYPGVVTQAEMHALENLRGIPKSLNNSLHLSSIRKDWNAFYKKAKEAGVIPNKEQLQKYSEYIDKKYGHLFDPPL